MELTTLKKIRMLYPGIYVIIQAVFIWLSNSGDTDAVFRLMDFSLDKERVVPVLVVLIIGLLYYAFDCRSILWKPIVNKVARNINERLLTIAKEDTSKTLSGEQKNSIKNLFYHFIGKDETLKTKAQNVMFNGAVLTSVLDTIILSVPILFIEVCIAIVKRSTLTWAFFVTLFLLLICIITSPRLIKKHIALSNDQLDYINDNYVKECTDEIKKILKNEC